MMSLGWLLLLLPRGAQDTPGEWSPDDLRKLSLEELLKIDVSIATRRAQPLDRVPAAVTVLRGEELRRLGIRSIPDALRYVPGAGVSHLDSSLRAVSIRGFGGRFSNKLQVLEDGRSIYSPIFSGVFWEDQDASFDDLDRIEVIRGPGASVWGANAMNGVVNLISKPSTGRRGGFAEAGGGSVLESFGNLRWESGIGESLSYRASAAGFETDSQGQGHDDWRSARARFRIDGSAGDNDTVYVQGSYYGVDTHHLRTTALFPGPPTSITFVDHERVRGGFAGAGWEHKLQGQDLLRVRASLEYTHRTRETADQEVLVGELDLSHQARLWESHDLTWGIGYRFSNDEIRNSFALSYDPDREHVDQVGAFLQDEVDLLPGLLRLLAGTRVEYHDYMGLEVLPTLRLTLTPAEQATFWTGISRSVRAPSRAEHDHRVNAAVFAGPTVVSIFGDSDVREEELIAAELGCRSRPWESAWFEAVVFHHDYQDLVSSQSSGFFVEPDPPPAHGVLAQTTVNSLEGQVYGVEVTAAWEPYSGWRLRGTYALLRMKLKEKDRYAYVDDETLNGEPRHRGTLWSSLDLPWNFSCDVAARWTGHASSPELSSWTELDARIAWQGMPRVELGIAGSNLLHAQHRETGAAASGGVAVTEADRSIYAFASWRF